MHISTYIERVMRGRLLLVLSLFEESREMVEGGKYKKCPCWLRPVGQALVGRALTGRALVGRAFIAPLSPYGLCSYGPPWALIRRALMGLPGPSWAGPLWARPSWAGPSWAPGPTLFYFSPSLLVPTN